MELRRYKNILALKTADNRLMGFHSLNLELAEIEADVWNAMSDITVADSLAPVLSETFGELEEWNNSESADTKDAVQHKSIRYFSVNVSQVCNLACTYCAAGGDGTYGSNVSKLNLDTTYAQLKWLMDKVPNGEMFEIRYLGGEPLLYPSVVRDIANYARLQAAGRNIQLQFSITTNGTLITSKVADLLADLKAEVTISLDGETEINDKVRPAKGKGKGSIGSTAMTIKGIQELKRVRPQLSALKVNSVFGEHNLDVLSTYKFLNDLGVEWDSMNLNYANNDKDAEFSGRYVDEMTLVARHAFETKGLLGLAQITQFRSPLGRIESQTRIHNYCGAGKSLLQSDTRGDLYTCNWFMTDKQDKVGQKTELNSDIWPTLDKTLIELNNCQTCWAKHLCGGGCMAVHQSKTGSKHSKDPHFCYRTRSLSAVALEYYYKASTIQTGERHEAN